MISSDVNNYDLHTIPLERARALIGKRFDEDYYFTRDPRLPRQGFDALAHYLRVGWREGRDPSPDFSTARYLEANPDVAAFDVNPLLHYVVYGRVEGRPAFRPTLPPLAESQRGALPPVLRLVPNIMTETHGEAAHASGEQARITDEMMVLRDHFDSQFYADRYADMRGPGVNALEHYCVFGWKEHRDPCAAFSTRRYLQANKDVAASGVNPFYQYIVYGRAEGRLTYPSGSSGPQDLAVDPEARLVTDDALRDLIRFPPLPPRRLVGKYNPASLVVDWVIPDFAVGSGGHMTLFRLVRWLELFGHRCRIWLSDLAIHENAVDAYDDILKYFQTIRAEVRLARDGLAEAVGDVLVATGWQTVARVMNATGFRERCYLVQDFEPSFYATGSHGLAAAWTYTQDLACICASAWLSEIVSKQFGRWTRTFALAYDPEHYYPRTLKSSQATRSRRIAKSKLIEPQIAVYARITTPRRCVELVLLALEHLAVSGTEFTVHLFGAEFEALAANFPCVSHGIVEPQALGRLYRRCDIGICLSATNYSLVPIEMMACGLPVLEIDTPSTRAVFPDGVVTRADAHPLLIAEAVQRLLHSPAMRADQAKAASKWIEGLSWEASARNVEQAMIERLAGRGHRAVANGRGARRKPYAPYVSVCIPTLNGGDLLTQVVNRLAAQRCPWESEIIILDSESDDGSIAALPDVDRMRIGTISRQEFQHGRARNQMAGMARGAFVAFLTQDACPANAFWLYNLVTTLEHFPNAGGVFGRHIPWPNASPFVRREIERHFVDFERYPLALSCDTDPGRWRSGDPAWRQILHFFSDNASCLRKSVWERLPFPEVDYGEDQLWCNRVLQAGLQRVYAPGAVVLHSHDYSPEECEKRAETEIRFFQQQFGYVLLDLNIPPEDMLRERNNEDECWARTNGIGRDQLEERFRLNEAWVRGALRGAGREAEIYRLGARGVGRPDTSTAGRRLSARPFCRPRPSGTAVR